MEKNKPYIITVSGEAQHGKDTTCHILVEELARLGFRGVRIAYADYLKHIAKEIYGWDGVKDEKGRSLLQDIGQRVREIYPDFWVSIVELTARVVLTEDFVIVPDTRYPNEIEYWEAKGYDVITINVTRPNFDNGLTPAQKNHLSETALNNYCFDYRLNNTSLDALRNQVGEVLLNIGI